jgi:hypothetical protein
LVTNFYHIFVIKIPQSGRRIRIDPKRWIRIDPKRWIRIRIVTYNMDADPAIRFNADPASGLWYFDYKNVKKLQGEVRPFYLSWIQIRIINADPDSADQNH